MKLILLSVSILVFFSIPTKTYEEQALFDYKCFLCKYSGDLIIDYHDKGARPTSLFNIITTLCTYLKIEDRVSFLLLYINCYFTVRMQGT